MLDHLDHAARIAAARSAIDHLTDYLDRRCYFSMTGGKGNPRLWAWHAASISASR